MPYHVFQLVRYNLSNSRLDVSFGEGERRFRAGSQLDPSLFCRLLSRSPQLTPHSLLPAQTFKTSNRPTRALEDLYSGENDVYKSSRYLNRPAQASGVFHGGEKTDSCFSCESLAPQDYKKLVSRDCKLPLMMRSI